MSHVTMIATHIFEQQTALLTGLLRDEAGVALGPADLTTLTLHLYDKGSGQIINARENINILNANGGTLDAAGNLTIQLDPADNALIDATQAAEDHILQVRWKYNGGAKAGAAEIQFRVFNLEFLE